MVRQDKEGRINKGLRYSKRHANLVMKNIKSLNKIYSIIIHQLT